MKRKGLMSTIIGIIAFGPSIIDNMPRFKRDLKKAGRRVTKISRQRKRGIGSLLGTGILGYGLAHIAPVRGFIRENNSMEKF